MTTHTAPVWAGLILATLGLSIGPLTSTRADTPAEVGTFITVPNPIDSQATNRVKEAFSRARRNPNLTTVILDFNPDGKEAASSEFGPCSDLADFLLEQNDLITVAFVRAKARRQTVLPVLACGQRVMASSAVLGEVLAEGERIAPRVKAMYEEVASKRGGPGRVPLVMKMLDRSVEVLEGRKAGAVVYVDAAKRAEAERDGVAITNPTPVLPANSRGEYTAADAQRFDLCNLVRDTRRQVAERYGLSGSSLREDPLGGRTAVVARVEASGEITAGMVSSFQRRVNRLTGRGANVVIVQVNCTGGDLVAAQELGEFLRTLRDPSPAHLPVVTIAYVPRDCIDLAHFIAFGCTEMVLGKDAALGDFDGYFRTVAPRKGGPPPSPPRNPEPVRVGLRTLAEEQNYPPILVDGFFQSDGEIVRARSAKGALEQTFMSRDALDADAKGSNEWKDAGTVKPAGKRLSIPAELARELNLARFVVDPGSTKDAKPVCEVYGFDPNKVREAGPDWLDTVATILSDPVVSTFLIMLGIGCLILELKMPGVGLPGVVAAVCFVLYFWSRSQMNGQFTLLAVMLFLMGLALIAIEIFLIPGFGLTGISGVVLLLGGLALATLERVPQSPGEWAQLGKMMTTFAGCMVGAAIGAFLAARFLPHIPYANRLVLKAPGVDAPEDPATVQQAATFALLGQFGMAATVLRPAGMAQFGEQYIDVVTEGGYVPAGARVQVVEIEGNRIVVKEV